MLRSALSVYFRYSFPQNISVFRRSIQSRKPIIPINKYVTRGKPPMVPDDKNAIVKKAAESETSSFWLIKDTKTMDAIRQEYTDSCSSTESLIQTADGTSQDVQSDQGKGSLDGRAAPGEGQIDIGADRAAAAVNTAVPEKNEVGKIDQENKTSDGGKTSNQNNETSGKETIPGSREMGSSFAQEANNKASNSTSVLNLSQIEDRSFPKQLGQNNVPQDNIHCETETADKDTSANDMEAERKGVETNRVTKKQGQNLKLDEPSVSDACPTPQLSDSGSKQVYEKTSIQTNREKNDENSPTRTSQEKGDESSKNQTSQEKGDKNSPTQTSLEKGDKNSPTQTSPEKGDKNSPTQTSPEKGDKNSPTQTSPEKGDKNSPTQTSPEKGDKNSPTQTSPEKGDKNSPTQTSPEKGDKNSPTQTSTEKGDENSPTQTSLEKGDKNSPTQTSLEKGDKNSPTQTSLEKGDKNSPTGASPEKGDEKSQTPASRDKEKVDATVVTSLKKSDSKSSNENEAAKEPRGQTEADQDSASSWTMEATETDPKQSDPDKKSPSPSSESKGQGDDDKTVDKDTSDEFGESERSWSSNNEHNLKKKKKKKKKRKRTSKPVTTPETGKLQKKKPKKESLSTDEPEPKKRKLNSDASSKSLGQGSEVSCKTVQFPKKEKDPKPDRVSQEKQQDCTDMATSVEGGDLEKLTEPDLGTPRIEDPKLSSNEPKTKKIKIDKNAFRSKQEKSPKDDQAKQKKEKRKDKHTDKTVEKGGFTEKSPAPQKEEEKNTSSNEPELKKKKVDKQKKTSQDDDSSQAEGQKRTDKISFSLVKRNYRQRTRLSLAEEENSVTPGEEDKVCSSKQPKPEKKTKVAKQEDDDTGQAIGQKSAIKKKERERITGPDNSSDTSAKKRKQEFSGNDTPKKHKGKSRWGDDKASGSGSDQGPRQKFKLVERTGDLFECPQDESLAHCISADVHMGKGIAATFKTKFGQVENLLRQGQEPGGLAVLQHRGRYIYYLVTKKKFHLKPTYLTLWNSLRAMQQHCLKHGVKKLSMPYIGCGLDRLDWWIVSSIIGDLFKETDMVITVYDGVPTYGDNFVSEWQPGRNENFRYEEKIGDLFQCSPDESLAHCISADVRMGKGIALTFKNRFGGVEKLLSQGQRPGGLAFLKVSDRYIYYLVTKECFNYKPTYDTLYRSLVQMRNHCLNYGVKKVSMPQIGCGLDGLHWPIVSAIIRGLFDETQMSITVYRYGGQQDTGGAVSKSYSGGSSFSSGKSSRPPAESKRSQNMTIPSLWARPSGSQKNSSEGEEVRNSSSKSAAKSSKSKPKFTFVETEGDIFKCSPDVSLAHCVDENFSMNKGVHMIFKKRFERVQELRTQGKKPGDVAVLDDKDRFIYYLVVKEKEDERPRANNLRHSLEAMRNHCLEQNVQKLSMPSGLFRFIWKEFVCMVKDVFEATDIEITVYEFCPHRNSQGSRDGRYSRRSHDSRDCGGRSSHHYDRHSRDYDHDSRGYGRRNSHR